MSKYDLTQEDYDLLKRLVVISRTVINNYYVLIDLENDGRKDTNQYNIAYEEFKTVLKMEAELYKQIKSAEKASIFVDYFLGNDQITFNYYLYTILDNTIDNLIEKRIVSKLEEFVNKTYFENDTEYGVDGYPLSAPETLESDTFESLDEEDYYENMQYSSLEDIEHDAESEFEDLNNVEIEIQNDVVRTILKILKEHIDNPYYNSIRYELIEFKYILGLVFPDIEKELLDNNFEINDYLVWKATISAQSSQVSDLELQIYKDEYCDDILETQRINLIDLLDALIEEIPDIHDSNYFIDAALSEILIRTCLLFVRDEVLNNYLTTVQNDLEIIETKNESVVPLVKSSMENYNKDRELPMVLRLNKNNNDSKGEI